MPAHVPSDPSEVDEGYLAVDDAQLYYRILGQGPPLILLHGDYDFVPVACAAHIAEAIPDARLVVLQDCWHFSYLERPDAVRKTLSEFFRAS